MIHFIDYTDNSDVDTEISEKKPYQFHEDLREKDIPELRRKCKLFREFESGTEWLYHNELFGMATNMVHVDKGKELFLTVILKVLEKLPEYWSYRVKHRYFSNYGLSYIEKKYTHPQELWEVLQVCRYM